MWVWSVSGWRRLGKWKSSKIALSYTSKEREWKRNLRLCKRWNWSKRKSTNHATFNASTRQKQLSSRSPTDKRMHRRICRGRMIVYHNKSASASRKVDAVWISVKNSIGWDSMRLPSAWTSKTILAISTRNEFSTSISESSHRCSTWTFRSRKHPSFIDGAMICAFRDLLRELKGLCRRMSHWKLLHQLAKNKNMRRNEIVYSI